jgi:hypothetical protein
VILASQDQIRDKDQTEGRAAAVITKIRRSSSALPAPTDTGQRTQIPAARFAGGREALGSTGAGSDLACACADEAREFMTLRSGGCPTGRANSPMAHRITNLRS